MQIASLAILLKTMPPGSVGFGSRDELPIVTRPAATSATPMSEPPCASLNLTERCLMYSLASSAASGATDVEPDIVMTGFATAVAGPAVATADTATHAASARLRFI